MFKKYIFIALVSLLTVTLAVAAAPRSYRLSKAFRAYEILSKVHHEVTENNHRYDLKFKPYVEMANQLDSILKMFPEEDNSEEWHNYYTSVKKYKKNCKSANGKLQDLMNYIDQTLKKPNPQIATEPDESISLYDSKELIKYKTTIRKVKSNFRACFYFGR